MKRSKNTQAPLYQMFIKEYPEIYIIGYLIQKSSQLKRTNINFTPMPY